MNETLTPEQIARVCHEANRALQAIDTDPVPSPPWEEAPDWQRASAIEGVRQALDGTTDPAAHHDGWCEAKWAAGWVYGPEKDAAAKTHPCLMPWDELPANQRRKNPLFLAIVHALSDDAAG